MKCEAQKDIKFIAFFDGISIFSRLSFNLNSVKNLPITTKI